MSSANDDAWYLGMPMELFHLLLALMHKQELLWQVLQPLLLRAHLLRHFNVVRVDIVVAIDYLIVVIFNGKIPNGQLVVLTCRRKYR